MKAITLVAMLLFATLAMSAQSNTHFVQHQDGLMGTADLFSSGESVFLQVSRGTDFFTGEPTTFIFFFSFADNPNGFTDTFGVGTIPNDSITGNDPAHVVLDVDLSQLNTVSGSSCTFNFVDFTETCQPLPLGVVHLEWRQTRSFSLHTVSDQQQTFSNFSLNIHQNSDTASAAVTGSFLGLEISDGGGQVGINHNSELELFVSPR